MDIQKLVDVMGDAAQASRENIRLGELIEYLKTLDPARVVKPGFGEPDSYRGYYIDVAFEPVPESTVAEMLAHAESALGKTFQGYKGGDYTMNEQTPCWVAAYGSCGLPMMRADSAFLLP